MNLRERFNLLRKGKSRMHRGKEEKGTKDRRVALVKNPQEEKVKQSVNFLNKGKVADLGSNWNFTSKIYQVTV